MSAIDIMRSFAESRSGDDILIRDGITYGTARDLLGAIAVLEAERDAARSERDELANEAMARENDDAMVCPEDWGIHEWVGALTRQRDDARAHQTRLLEEVARLREALTAVLASPEELFLPATGERAIFVTKEVEAKARAALEGQDG